MQVPAFGFKPGITDMTYRDPRQPVPGLLGGSAPASPPQMGGEGAAFDPNMVGEMPNAHGPAFNKAPAVQPPPASLTVMPPNFGQPPGRGQPYISPGTNPYIPPGYNPGNGQQLNAPTNPYIPPDYNPGNGQQLGGGMPAMPPGRGQPYISPGGPTNYPGIERPMPPAMNGGNLVGGGTMSPGGVRPGTFYRPRRTMRGM